MQVQVPSSFGAVPSRESRGEHAAGTLEHHLAFCSASALLQALGSQKYELDTEASGRGGYRMLVETGFVHGESGEG